MLSWSIDFVVAIAAYCSFHAFLFRSKPSFYSKRASSCGRWGRRALSPAKQVDTNTALAVPEDLDAEGSTFGFFQIRRRPSHKTASQCRNHVQNPCLVEFTKARRARQSTHVPGFCPSLLSFFGSSDPRPAQTHSGSGEGGGLHRSSAAFEPSAVGVEWTEFLDRAMIGEYR